jgi:ABC-2 type transport system ATP-binding protein
VATMLDCKGLRKRWGPVQALDGFDLTIAAGEICGLMGHNGAGKTTFARICAGLERPDAGTVIIDGIDIATDGRTARVLVGLAPQEIALYPTVTLKENLMFFGGLAGMPDRLLRREIDEIAQAMELTDVLPRLVGELSGGMQRRAQAATTLIHRPVVLLLDEPTVGADPTSRQALLAVVADRAAQGAAVCYTTHYLPELQDLGATLAVASRGRIIARGGREELLAGLPGQVVIGFGGPPPASLAGQATGTTESGELTFRAVNPAQTLARLLAELEPGSSPVRAVEVLEPSLDDLYRHLSDRNADVLSREPANAGADHDR